MPWLRVGDDAAMRPELLEVAYYAGGDPRMINETAGFLFRCAASAAGYITDYVVTFGTALQIAGSPDRLVALTDACVRAGLMEVVELEGKRAWKIVDNPEFIHMKTEEELKWEKQRRADNGSPELTLPIRYRDGDSCRYCGRVVKWNDKKGGIGGTYDHRRPGEPGTVETMVVACRSCNAKRGDAPDADDRVPLWPAPDPVYYDKVTIEMINKSSWARDNGVHLPPKRDKFVPCGSVPPGHESHVPVPEELLIESPVEPAPDIRSAGDGTGVDSQTPPPMPAWLGDAVSSTPAPDIQSGSDGIEGDSTEETMPTESTTTDTAVPGLAPASATPAPDAQSGSDGIADGGRASSGRAATCGDTRQRNSVLPAGKTDLPEKADQSDRRTAGSGFVGTGRDGTGVVGIGNGKGRDGEGTAGRGSRSPGSSRGSGRKRRRRRKKGR